MVLRLMMSFLDTEYERLQAWANWERMIGKKAKATRIARVAERLKQREER